MFKLGSIKNKPDAWRIAIIVAVPLALLAWHLAVYDVIHDSAGGLSYAVHINRLTDDACLEFPGRPSPVTLRDLAC